MAAETCWLDHDWDTPADDCECGDGYCMVRCTVCGEEERECEEQQP